MICKLDFRHFFFEVTEGISVTHQFAIPSLFCMIDLNTSKYADADTKFTSLELI